MQIRRVLLLFALVLGLSALVAAIAPPPEEEPPATTAAPPPPSGSGTPVPPVRLRVRGASARPVTRRIRTGSSFSLTVAVPKAGDVVLEGLGPRQTADPLTPAEFALLASPPGLYDVAFLPIDGRRRVVGRLAFVDAAAAKRRPRDR